MKPQEIAIYREIQRNTERAMKAIDTLSDKVYDQDMARQISRQSYEYSKLHGEAVKALLDAKADGYRENRLADMRLRAGIHYNTLLNTSTGHLAELMIRENNNGALEMEKVLKHNETAGSEPVFLAKQLLALDAKNIARLKDFL